MKTMYATRDFKDAGTGRSFARGEPMTDVDEGTVGNYEAAKLVTDENPNPVSEAAPVAPTEPQADAAEVTDEFAPAASSEPAEGEAPQAAAEPQADAAPEADAEPKSTRRRKAADAD